MVFPADTCFWMGCVIMLELSSAGISVAPLATQAIERHTHREFRFSMCVFNWFPCEQFDIVTNVLFFVFYRTLTIDSISGSLYHAQHEMNNMGGKIQFLIYFINISYLPPLARPFSGRHCCIAALPELTSRWQATVCLKRTNRRRRALPLPVLL